MRNLKKFLALVLAMMMVFSLMLTANAANVSYGDKDSITKEFQEAVNVLSGIGVVKGDAGNFNPAGKLTRAEAATIMYRIVTGDAEDKRVGLYTQYGNFNDVKSSDWFSGYVGYCANQGIIQGDGAGNFLPYGNVDGYQMLTMLLRAIGYTNLTTFAGSDWRTQVASGATQLGLLKNVNSAGYGGNLYTEARRDAVAEMTFQAIQKPQVIDNGLGGYTKYTSLVSTTENPTLGEKWFGLTCNIGVVVGNQATGEDGTQVTFSLAKLAKDGDPQVIDDTTLVYEYCTTATDATTSDPGKKTVGFDYTTGLGQFGHKVKVWYNADSSAVQTYYIEDVATLAAVVGADSVDDIKDGNKDAKHLATAAKTAGFALPADVADFYPSASFSRFGSKNGTVTITDSKVFVLISNNDKKTVDVVIPVVLDVGEISEINNQASSKTLIVKGATHAGLDTAQAQADVMNPEAIVLGNTVIAVQVTKNTADDGDPVWWLDTPTKQVTKEIVAIDSADQTILCTDGTEYARTIIDNTTLVSGDTNVKTLVAGQTTYAKYIITLDAQGNWLHAVRSYDNNFIYGTYLDWATSLGSSKFTYKMIGLDMNGTQIDYEVKKWVNASGDTKTLGVKTEDVKDVGVPYRDDLDEATGVKGRPDTKYMGFIVNGTTASNDFKELQTVAGIQSFGEDGTYDDGTVDFKANIASNGDLKITADDLKLGVKLIKETADPGEEVNLYLTENTKFIVVSGYGTDSLKPVVYNGLTKFLGESGSVQIKASTDVAKEILYTSAPYIYANTGSSAREVKTVFIPGGCVTRTGTSSMYYFPTKSTVVDSDDSTVHLLTAYKGGEKVTVWINDDGNTAIEANIDTNKFGSFQNLEATAGKASDGRPIYKLADAPTDDAPDAGDQEVWTGDSYAGVKFNGTTNNGLTCIVSADAGATNKLAGTANVKVVNLVKGYTINDINDLNDVASVKDTVTVVIEYADTGSVQIATIYVVKIA